MGHVRSWIAVVLAVVTVGACDSGQGPTAGSSTDGWTRLDASRNYAEFSDYVVHVNGMSTVSLTPEIAANYGITRSENRGMINVVVLRKTAEVGMDTPVAAAIQLTAANLTAQVKPVKLTEVRDGASIYYLGVVSADRLETINFDMNIRPEGASRNLQVRYTHQFYTR